MESYLYWKILNSNFFELFYYFNNSFFGTSIVESGSSDNIQKYEHLLVQFMINFEYVMYVYSEDDLNSGELHSCLDIFEKIREFHMFEDVDSCDDKQIQLLKQNYRLFD